MFLAKELNQIEEKLILLIKLSSQALDGLDGHHLRGGHDHGLVDLALAQLLVGDVVGVETGRHDAVHRSLDIGHRPAHRVDVEHHISRLRAAAP